jgi:alpha-L-rhamnosidase
VPALSGYVLGIRPVRPGWSAWVVQPQVGDLRWAQGQAPAASGAVVSRWERGTRSFRLTAGGPAGTTGSVSVPLLGSPRTIARDGHVVWANGRPVGSERAVRIGDEIRFDGVQGLHTWAWTAPSGA